MREEFGTGRPSAPRASVRPRALVLLAAMLFVESAFLAAAAGFLVFELATVVPVSYASAIAILLLVALAALWLFVVAVNTLKGRSWVRGAALTWQVLQLAIALGSFQGLFARDDIGWFLLVPAVIVLFLLFTRSVIAATTRRS
ncbi:MAG TPA: hypothetical protein VIQ78_02295 [Terrimesophilobacter sp.]|uniref:hypothetical protein n=1 Tax=Terrimesophilobacter sp. TaxID=2906435 RepID=UPI002F9420B5